MKISHKIAVFLLLLICCILDAFSQNNTIHGKIIDSKSKEPLAFVNIVINKNKVVTTDIDGKFFIKEGNIIDSLQISYLGYKPLVYKLNKKRDNITILLERNEFELPEVTILPGINPAHRIINNVINNREINNPERLDAFAYTSYNKMVFTVDVDSIKKKGTDKLDPADKRMIGALNKMHLFLMESVTEHKFIFPDKHNEKVIANKTSGIKEPLLVMLASQYQSFSFYNDFVQIAEKPYLNPIARGSINKYIFILKDTLYKDKDTVFIISFLPRKNKNFEGLTGILYINTNRYAVENVIAKPADETGDIKVKIQQLYEFIDNKQWFPVQLNTDIEFANLKINNSKVVARGNTYLKDIKINPDLKPRHLGNSLLEVLPDAGDKTNEYWASQRKDSISKKEQTTYKIIDSIGKVYHFDRVAKNIEKILLGKVSYKFIDFEIGRFFRYSDYEGYMLGLGLQTNNKIAKWFKTGGYYSYAFKLKKPVYGANLDFFIDKQSELNLKFSYVNDYEETGGHKFFDNNNELLNADNFRDFLVLHKDKIERKECSVGFRLFKYANMHIGLSDTRKEITNSYQFGKSNENVKLKINSFNITELTIGMKYAYNERFIKTPYYSLSVGTKYPILWFQYKKGFDNLLNGYFSYNRYDFKVKKSFVIKNLGKSNFEIVAGYIDNNIPLSNLYNGNGVYRKITIDAPYSFAAMRFNEFYSDKYVNLFFTHSFGNLLLKTKKFKPEFVIASNIAYGSIQNKQSHYDVIFKTLDKGYFESGLLINSLVNMKFYSLGIGCYYRYGYYQFDKPIDNIAVKFTVTFPFIS